MLLAIDVGNTDCKFGLYNSKQWLGVWRLPTVQCSDPKVVLSWLNGNIEQAGVTEPVDQVGCASVVPALNPSIDAVSTALCGKEVFFVQPQSVGGLEIFYGPKNGLGADRLANALGGLAQFKPPLVIIDFGSATTMDVVTGEGFLGGAIMPGVALQAQSLVAKTAQLPQVALAFPPNVVGASTEHCIQSGILYGHLSAVEGMIVRFAKDLKDTPTVIGTGGLMHYFIGATDMIHHFVSTLTLDGVVEGVRRAES